MKKERSGKALKFRKKPIIIDAIHFDGSNAVDVLNFIEMAPAQDDERVHHIIIPTLEGDMTAVPGDWIIRGIRGEYYPIKPEIFTATYEPVD